jgi:thiol-disulfide isomerase/thioredoxin
MDKIMKTVCLTSLLAIFILAFSINVMGVDYSVGPGNDSWWTTYPDQSSVAGGEVSHPDWVLEALESKPVVIYAHSGCSYCQPQTDAMGKIVDELGDEFTYFDLSADGSDARSDESLQAYDPNSRDTMYVPLTVILTLAPDSEGEVVPVWHSTDEVTGESWIQKYIEDAVDYHSEYSADWDK